MIGPSSVHHQYNTIYHHCLHDLTFNLSAHSITCSRSRVCRLVEAKVPRKATSRCDRPAQSSSSATSLGPDWIGIGWSFRSFLGCGCMFGDVVGVKGGGEERAQLSSSFSVREGKGRTDTSIVVDLNCCCCNLGGGGPRFHASNNDG